jgi:hypothetical protein
MTKTGTDKPSVHRVAMAKRVASSWLEERTTPHHRLTVYSGHGRESRNLPGLLRAFRDGRVKMGAVPPIRDLGVRPEFDHVVIWSKDAKSLQSLDEVLRAMGLETSGVA